MADMTDRERIERLEWVAASLIENLTRNFPTRAHDIGHEELKALAADVRARADVNVAERRRQLLEAELAELGPVAG